MKVWPFPDTFLYFFNEDRWGEGEKQMLLLRLMEPLRSTPMKSVL